jgi:hypothetical protein
MHPKRWKMGLTRLSFFSRTRSTSKSSQTALIPLHTPAHHTPELYTYSDKSETQAGKRKRDDEEEAKAKAKAKGKAVVAAEDAPAHIKSPPKKGTPDYDKLCKFFKVLEEHQEHEDEDLVKNTAKEDLWMLSIKWSLEDDKDNMMFATEVLCQVDSFNCISRDMLRILVDLEAKATEKCYTSEIMESYDMLEVFLLSGYFPLKWRNDDYFFDVIA